MSAASRSVEFHPACEARGRGGVEPSLEDEELCPGSTGRTEVRVLFAFDRERRAILLLGGDMSDDWRGWYTVNVPIADDRFDQHRARLNQPTARPHPKRRRTR